MIKILQLILVVFIFSGGNAIAKIKLDDDSKKLSTYKKCASSKKGPVDSMPAQFASDNDLTRNEGGFFNSYNQKIIIRGIIKDKNCVPVSNANVKLWQVDSYGKVRYETQRMTKKEKYDQDKIIYSDFQGTGMFTSLNNGEFFFITVMPSELSKSAHSPKYINLQINHDDFPKLSNKIYFLETAQFSNKDNVIIAKNYFSTEFKDIKIYDTEIILDGVSIHNQF